MFKSVGSLIGDVVPIWHLKYIFELISAKSIIEAKRQTMYYYYSCYKSDNMVKHLSTKSFCYCKFKNFELKSFPTILVEFLRICRKGPDASNICGYVAAC